MNKLEVFMNRKAVRDIVADIDYVKKLSTSEREWLELFVNATGANDLESLAAIVTPNRFRRVYKEITDASNARRRDITTNFTRIPKVKDEGIDDEDNPLTYDALIQIRSEMFEHYKCSRCLRKAGLCQCPAKQRNQPYGREDYIPVEVTEDNVLAQIDIKKRMQAYDLLPYGTDPQGLKPGHTVQICLPFHLFKNASGTVVEQRETDGKYLVNVISRKGLKDRDGTVPKEITIWVAGSGLRRYPPSIVRKA